MKGGDVDRVANAHIVDDSTGLVRPEMLAAASTVVMRYIRTHATVLGSDATPCRAGADAVAPDGDGAVIQIVWSCAGVVDPLRYRSTVLIDLSPDARQVVLIGLGADATQALLDSHRTETTLTATPQPGLLLVIRRYVDAGVEHIFLGYDHIAFLAAVVLWARRLWP